MADEKKKYVAPPQKPANSPKVGSAKRKYVAPTVEKEKGGVGKFMLGLVTPSGDQSILDMITAPARRTANQASALVSGGLLGATAGTAPTFQAGMEAASYNPFAGPVLGSINVAKKLLTGDELIDDRAMRNRYDAPIAEHQGWGLAGQIGGSVLPGSAAIKGVNAATKAAPLLGKLRGILPRVLAAAGYGGGEAATQARMADERVGPAAAIGAVTGGVAQGVLGELLPNAYRAIKNSDAGVEGAAFLRSVLDEASGGRATAASTRQAVTDLGPNAQLVDAPYIDSAAKQILNDPNTVGGTGPLIRMLDDRLNPNSPDNVRNRFAAIVKDWVPDTFKRADLGATDARHFSRMVQEVTEEQKALQPQFAALLDDGPQVYATDTHMRKLIDEVMLPDGPLRSTKFFVDRHAALVRDLGRMTNGGVRAMDNRALDNVIKQLRDDARGIFDKAETTPTERFIAGRYLELAKRVEDSTLANLPKYGELRAKYRTVEEYKEAYKLGNEIFKLNPDKLDMLPTKLEALPKAAQPAFFEGLTSAFADAMDTNRATGATLARLTQSQSFNDTLGRILPTASADAIRQAADEAVAMHNTASKLLQGSQTAGRIVSGKKAEARSAFNRAVISSFLTKLVGLGGASTVGTIGAAKQEVTADMLNPEMARRVSQALSTGETGLGSIMRQIYDGNLAAPSDNALLNVITKPGAATRDPAMLGTVLGGAVGYQRQQGAGDMERRERGPR